MEGRLVPATTVPHLGNAAVFIDLTSTPTTTQLAVVVPNGNVVQHPPQPIAPPTPIREAVIAFETANGYPPTPIVPGLLVAADIIAPPQPI
jgi:hypothetical protein